MAVQLVIAVGWELSRGRRQGISVPFPLGLLYGLHSGWVQKLRSLRDKKWKLPVS